MMMGSVQVSVVDRGVARIEMTSQMLSNLSTDAIAGFRIGTIRKGQMFDKILGYEGIKRTSLRSLNSTELVFC